MMTGLVKFFYERVINGNKLWTEIPPTWQKKVREQLLADGYILNEDGTVTIKISESDSLK